MKREENRYDDAIRMELKEVYCFCQEVISTHRPLLKSANDTGSLRLVYQGPKDVDKNNPMDTVEFVVKGD